MEYPKKAEPMGEQVAQGIRDTVSRIRLDVEKEGIAAIRRYSLATRPLEPRVVSGRRGGG